MMDIVDEQTPRERMRVSDADRERVAGRLQSAHAEGRLDLGEYDERVRQAWAARTYGELDRLTCDLPSGGSQPVPVTRSEQHEPEECGGGRRGMVRTWLAASLINLVIWAVVSLSTLSWIYPWWIWVAGPWGAVLLAGWVIDRSGRARPQH